MDTEPFYFETDETIIGNILIVDDTLPNLKLLSNMLQEKGHKVRGVTNGAAALTAVNLAPPDLILLDINMPDMNGYEVCRQLKANLTTRRIPIIFISAINELLDKVKAFTIGGVDYITKPFQLEEVMVRVQNHLQLRLLQKKLEEAVQELRRQVTLDGLTQIANRRRFDEYIHEEWRRMAREQRPLSLILCDIDFFKLFNDTYGHQLGDDCLKKVAQTMDSTLKRASDLVARYGGEEFGIILPNTDLEGAVQVAKILNQAVQQLTIPHEQSTISSYVSISLGVSSVYPVSHIAFQPLIKAADAALYLAKLQGRNRIATQPCLLEEKTV